MGRTRAHTGCRGATFVGGALDGLPALTPHGTAAGAAWYLPTRLDDEPLAALVEQLAAEAGVTLSGPASSGWVEVVRRGGREFIINHGFETVRLEREGVDELTGQPVRGLELAPHGVVVVR
ncbi:MAG: beta-galactosidase [Microbacterium sp.]|jgi:beta-galactosidase|nr:beta-galactosidase [Microbacterium sp.]